MKKLNELMGMKGSRLHKLSDVERFEDVPRLKKKLRRWD